MQEKGLNVLDIVILVFFVYNAYLGFKKGFVKMALDLTALIIGLFVAIRYYMPGALFLEEWVYFSSPYSIYLSFILIWGVVFGGAFLFNIFCHKILRKTPFIHPLNHFFGAFFGGLRGLCYVIPFLIPLSHTGLLFYHESKIAIPLKEMASKRFLNTKQKEGLINRLGLKQTETVVLKKDKNLRRVRRALESGNTGAIQDLFQDLGTK